MGYDDVINKIIGGANAAASVANAIGDNANMAGKTLANFKSGLNGQGESRPINDFEVTITEDTKIFIAAAIAAILFVIIKKRK